MREDRLVRLLDIEPHEVVTVKCQCGRSADYAHGLLQRLHKLPSDTLIYDVQFKLRCVQCRRTSGFRIAILDGRQRGGNGQRPQERVIVPGGL